MLQSSDKAEVFAFAWRVCAPKRSPAPVREFRFLAGRRFRFDFAWPDWKVAVEVDGNAWHVKGGGRHGMDSDREKMNLAAAEGWLVLRFSPRQLEVDPSGCVALVFAAKIARWEV